MKSIHEHMREFCAQIDIINDIGFLVESKDARHHEQAVMNLQDKWFQYKETNKVGQ